MSQLKNTFACRVCENPVSVETNLCTFCGFQHLKNFKFKFLFILLGLIACFTILTFYSIGSEHIAIFSDNEELLLPAHGQNFPLEEQKFIEVLTSYKNIYMQSEEEKENGSYSDVVVFRAQRKQDIESLKLSAKVVNWVGEVTFLQLNGQGNATLCVSISPDIVLQTAKHAREDFATNSIILKNTSLFNQVKKLEKGDFVTFSGTFFPASEDIFKELSLSMHASMVRPTFLFDFTSVTKQ